MTEHTSPAGSDDVAAQSGSASHNLDAPEALRAVLIRLHESGPGAWQHDREAGELMRYTAIRYRPLAQKHGLDAWEIASAAFEVMLAPSTRKARNPWAVVTRAVQITCGVEIRAAGMLVSSGKVRHTSRVAGFHDAIRFAEREHMADYHPAFAVNSASEDEDDSDDSDHTRVAAALSAIVELFASTGWDGVLVADCVEHVAYRLADLTSRSNAVEVLRRDHAISVLLDVPPKSWATLLRIVLGHPDRKHAGAPTGDGVLLRLLNGEPLDSLRCDTGLLAAIWAAKPDAPCAASVRGRDVPPISMSTPPAASTRHASPSRPAGSTPGARLAAASRQAQGFPSTVSDPAVLAELRGLCTAPRPTKRTTAVTRRGPAP